MTSGATAPQECRRRSTGARCAWTTIPSTSDPAPIPTAAAACTRATAAPTAVSLSNPDRSFAENLTVGGAGLLTLVYELKPVAPGQGGFGCIPGSHRPDFPALPEHEGWRKSWATDELRGAAWPANVPVHRIEAEPGSCIIFTEKLLHGTLPWAGGGERRTLFCAHLHTLPSAHSPPLTPQTPRRQVCSVRLPQPGRGVRRRGPRSDARAEGDDGLPGGVVHEAVVR